MQLRLRQGTALLALTCGLACALNASAQRGRRQPLRLRVIQGQVLNHQNSPVAWAYVSLQGEMGGVASDTTTGPRGRFRFDRVQPRVYTVVARMVGYQTAGQRVDMTLQPRAYVLLTLHPKKGGSEAQPVPEQAAVSVQELEVPKEALAEFTEGKKAVLEKRDMEAGEEHFREAIRLYPAYTEAYVLLATCYIDEKKWGQAEETLKRSLEIDDRYAPSYFALAALHKQQGNTEQAQAALERGLQSDPSSAEGHLELAETLLAQDQVAQAEIHAGRAHELAPKKPLVHVVLANILLRKVALRKPDPQTTLAEYQTVREEYQHYLDLAPDGPLAAQVQEKIDVVSKKQRQLELLASTRRAAAIPAAAQREFDQGKKEVDKGQLKNALKHFRKAVDTHPAFVQGCYMMGTVLMRQQEWNEAEKTLKRCLEIDDSYALVYVALGAFYNLQGKPAQATPVLQRAVELDANSWQGHFELAQSLLGQREVAEAETHARLVHESQTSFPLVHVLLGNINLSKRDLASARDEFQHYLDLAPEGPLAPQLRAKVEQIDSALAQQAGETPKP